MTFDTSWKNQETQALFEAVLSLNTVDEASLFFRDLCTIKELNDMSQRWAVARQLEQGLSYREISAVTGVATATITRINQWLRHGTGGYQLALTRMRPESEDTR